MILDRQSVMVEKKPVALYDMSIEDVKERAEKRLEFESLMKAANFLGTSYRGIIERIKLKQYTYHKETKKKYAPRYIK